MRATDRASRAPPRRSPSSAATRAGHGHPADPGPPLRRSTRWPRWPSGCELGSRSTALARGLEGFTGTRRRMERKGEAAGVRVYDSYAHHPAEIAGDLEAARAVAGEGRLVVAFQPHLVSRTRMFGAGDGGGAGRGRRGRRARRLPRPRGRRPRGDRPPRRGRRPAARRTGSPSSPASTRRRPSWPPGPAPGDLVLTLGAGSVTEVGPRVLELLGSATGDGGLSDARRRAAGRARPRLRSRQRFARRQWARRWLAWRYVVRASCCRRAGRRRHLARVLLLRARGEAASTSRATTSLHARPRSGAAAVPAGEPLARRRPRSDPGRRARARRRAVGDVSRKWPDRVLITVEERVAVAVVEIGGRLRGMDPTGGLQRVRQGRRPACRAVSRPPRPAATRCRRPRRWSPPCRGARRRWSTTSRSRPSTRSRWCCATGGRACGGARTSPRTKAEVLLELLPQPAEVYDVSVPGQPTTCRAREPSAPP